jgi:cation transport regulator ChaC
MVELWYFAYGWSMDKSLMRKCIGDWLDARHATLKGFEIVFNAYSPAWRGGVANLRESENARIIGVAYKITHDQLAKLDAFEGVPSRASRRMVLIEVEGVGEVKAITHVAANPRDGFVQPSKEYLSAMHRGIKQHGIPDEMIKAIQRAGVNGLRRGER